MLYHMFRGHMLELIPVASLKVRGSNLNLEGYDYCGKTALHRCSNGDWPLQLFEKNNLILITPYKNKQNKKSLLRDMSDVPLC